MAKNPIRPLTCECSDSGCIVHENQQQCVNVATTRVRRIDMEDGNTTFAFCDPCALDALDRIAEVRQVLFQFLASGVAEVSNAYGPNSEQARIADRLRDAMAIATHVPRDLPPYPAPTQ